MSHPEDATSRLPERRASRGSSRCPFPRPLCHLWPGNDREDDPMIRAPFQSSEAALEHQIEEVVLGVSYLPPTDAFHKLVDAVDKSLSNAGLSSPGRAQHNGQYAGIDQGINFDCPFPPPQDIERGEEADDDLIVLAVEATRDSLSLSVWHAECAMWELMRQAPQSFELGSTALTVCREQQDRRCLHELERAVRQIMAVPIEAGGGVYDRMGAVVVFGEGVKDRDLNSVIRTVLLEQYCNSIFRLATRASGQSRTFAASQGLAIMMWEIIEADEQQSRFELR